MTDREFLSALMGCSGVSGEESSVVDCCERQLGIAADRSCLGSGIFTVTTGDGPHIVLNAHMDNIGFMVTYVDDNGFANLGPVGGIDPRLLPASVLRNCRNGSYGVVTSTPPHLLKGEEKVVPVQDAVLDTGNNRDVRPGDRYVFVSKTQQEGDRFWGPNLDDRAGIAAVVMAAEKIKSSGFQGRLSLLLSSMEETGEQGAAAGGFALQPDSCICVDVSFGYREGLNRKKCGVVGNGPMIGVSPTLDEDITRELIRLAKKKDIPYQKEVMTGVTGTDADKLTISAGGIPVGVVSIPLYEMHTPTEGICFSDVEQTAALLTAYVLEGDGR